jgi:hypothetical protein
MKDFTLEQSFDWFYFLIGSTCLEDELESRFYEKKIY